MIDFSIKNPLLVNLFLILILLLGILSWQSMPEEMFPVVEKDRIKITTSYDGASPEEIEQQVTIPIEDALDNMQDIDFYYSHSKEGISIVTLVLKPDSNIEELMREVRDLVDAIDDFPVEADQPAIIRVKTRFPVISVSLFGDARDSLLFEQSKIIKQKLLQLSGVAGVGISGNREKEIWVEINPEEMSWGITGGETRFQMLARVHDPENHLGISIKADLDESDLSIESWSPIYPGADWHERETSEMFGIVFLNHPNPVNLYLPGDFEGYPLRKDFALLSRRIKPWPGIVDVEDMPGEESEDEEVEA